MEAQKQISELSDEELQQELAKRVLAKRKADEDMRGYGVLSSVPKNGKFTLGKKYKIVDSELWSSRYAEFEVADDNGALTWVCCGHFNEPKYAMNPETCPCCKRKT